MDEEKRYTITLTERQIEEIRNAREDGATLNDDTLAALDAAKPVREKKPKAAAIDDEPLVPTGNADLDAFIAAHHRPDWRDRLKRATRRTVPGWVSMPSPAPGWPTPPRHPSIAVRMFGAPIGRPLA